MQGNIHHGLVRIVVLGAAGMLGHDVVCTCRAMNWEVYGFDLPEVDIASEEHGLDRLPDCDWVVNCAAYTDVDGAETERGKAFAVNCDGARRVATWCARKKTRLLHLSTDYVFDGNTDVPYVENDPPAPLNVYGWSKYEGERAVRREWEQALIVRTQSLFGRHGRNFVRAILKRIIEGERTLEVVCDQVSCPTYTQHLAEALRRLMAGGFSGTVHVSSSGQCSWYEFARAIVEAVGAHVEIRAVSAARYGRPARRPAFSVLSKALYSRLTGHTMPSWEEGLAEYLREEPFRTPWS
ncbi:MAG: dTDP-4-dehydrorhamnose reductase [Kiritimatiellae bacterium]|nr:dTDP-4-dehydrorhamnose reductase [Kiritimatiellia bacterium]